MGEGTIKLPRLQYVNVDPTKEQDLDIKQEDLLKEKSVIMPKA